MATVEPGGVRRGRGRELVLLVLAVALGLGAYVAVAMASQGSLPPDLYISAGALVLIAVVLHLLVRYFAPYADPVLLPVAVALNGIGLAMIYRLDLAAQAAGRNSSLAGKQLLLTGLGVLAAAVVLAILRDHRVLRRFTYTAMLVSLGLIMLPFVPGLGKEVYGARIWIGAGDFSLQPAELAKISLAIFFAGYLVTNRDTLALAGPKVLGIQLPRVRDLGPILIVWIMSITLLVAQRDLGTSLLFFGLFVAMLYIATERMSWIVIGLALFAGGAFLAAQKFGHVAARFDVWLNAMDPAIYERHPGGSRQVVQGMFGLANGGLFGTGWAQGHPNLVPFASSDFITTSLGEELGLTGLLAILVCYMIFVERGIRIALGVRDGFGKLLAAGLAFVVAWQVFVVVGGVLRVIPLTGLTMPFLAYGGSSLLANWLIVAILLRISDNARRPTPLPVRGSSPITFPEAAENPDEAEHDDAVAYSHPYLDENLQDEGEPATETIDQSAVDAMRYDDVSGGARPVPTPPIDPGDSARTASGVSPR